MKNFKSHKKQIQFNKEYLAIQNMITEQIHDSIVNLTLKQINDMNEDHELFITAHKYIEYLRFKFDYDHKEYEEVYHDYLEKLVDIEIDKIYS